MKLKKYIAFAKKGLHYIKEHGIPETILEEEKNKFQIHPEEVFGYVLNQETVPFSRIEYDAAKNGPLLLNWVIPEMGKGSGGHINIFRFVTALEKRGVKNRIFTYENKLFPTDAALTEFLHTWYPTLDPSVELHATTENMPFCHGVVATSWPTAYVVKNFNNTVSKFYFVQDFEPYFYPISSEYIFAEKTYHFGFRGLTAGDWLKKKLETEYKMTCDSFRFSYDKDIYVAKEKRDHQDRIFFYARPVTPRRAFEAGLLALTELYRRRPDIEVVFAGWDISNYYIPFKHRNCGSLALTELSDLYAQCDICLVMSLTNLSLLPLEVMASNSVIATQGAENNAWMIDENNAIIVDTDPVNVADKLVYYLDHREELAKIRQAGLEYALNTDWEQEADKVYNSIVKAIGEDERQRIVPYLN